MALKLAKVPTLLTIRADDILTDTDGDGRSMTPTMRDDDNDGLIADADEAALGTDPLNQ